MWNFKSKSMSLVGLVLLGTIGCSNPKTTQANPKLVDGNWRIVGTRSQTNQPYLSIAMGVTGNVVIGSGDAHVPCAHGGYQGASPISFTGQMAADGSFQMNNPSQDTLQIQIQGQAPVATGAGWSGKYTMINKVGETACQFDVAADFVATPYAPLEGTYTGTITGIQSGKSVGLDLTTKVTQGVFSEVRPNSAFYAIPLAANVTVKGSSCFHSGSTTDGATSTAVGSISGDVFELNYWMNDGSVLSLFGYFTDDTETKLQVQFANDFAGKCAWSEGSGVLNRD